KTITSLPYSNLRLAEGQSPAARSGAQGSGQMFLSEKEDSELNHNMKAARDYREASGTAQAAASSVFTIPNFEGKLHYWGIGGSLSVVGGSILGAVAKVASEVLQMKAAWEQDQGAMAGRTAGYERRADEWLLQANLAGRELMQIGRQVISSLIVEQVAF